MDERVDRPSLFYLFASSDSDHCCASAIERGFFRTQKFVQLAHAFNCYKLDRNGSRARELMDRFKVSDRPAVLLLDSEGSELGRLDDHIDHPAVFERLLRQALLGAKLRQRDSKRTLRDLDRASAFREQGNFPMALRLLRDARKRQANLFERVRQQLDTAQAQLQEAAHGSLSEALELIEAGRFAEAHDKLISVRERCRGLDASSEAQAALRKLRDDPVAAAAIEEGQRAKRRPAR